MRESENQEENKKEEINENTTEIYMSKNEILR